MDPKTTQGSTKIPGTAGFRISVAPMMDVTDRHFRALLRLISSHAHLYTEMIHARAVLANPERYAAYDPVEEPVVLQLGGNDPAMLGSASKIARDLGWKEINLNCGCPSERVEAGGFGACLMKNPQQTAEIVHAMTESGAAITVKHRIGISESRGMLESTFENLHEFVRVLKEAGAVRFIVHARIAVLDGLSTAENRSIPPLRFDVARRLKSEFPGTLFEINGGIRSLSEAGEVSDFDGVMLGRAVRDNPMVLAGADELLGRPGRTATLAGIIDGILQYLETTSAPPHLVLRHLVGLASGRPGARRFRRFLGERLHHVSAGHARELLKEAAGLLS